MIEDQIKKNEQETREFDSLDKLEEKEKAIKAKLAKFDAQLKHNNSKKRKARTRALCKVGGFLFSEIAGWTGEDEGKIGKFDYNHFCKCCRANKDELAKFFITKEDTQNTPIPNVPTHETLNQNQEINNSQSQYYQQF